MPDALPRALRLAAALLCLVWPAIAQTSAQIEAGDRLDIAVGRWDPVAEQYTGWPDLGGSYAIGVDGMLVLPLAGAIPAEGLTAVELSERISIRLGESMGLTGQISAAVGLATPDPVYVIGGVEQAGAYPSRPGLTVLQAVSLAGGVTSSGATFLRSERDALSTMGQYRVLELSLLRNLAIRARLRAELAETEMIETPPEVARAPLGETLMEQERAIRAARDAELESSLNQLDELEQLLNERITRIDSQLDLRDRQLVLAREELEDARQLVERGLSVDSRRNRLDRLVADQEARILDLETAQLRAAQRLNELGRDRLDLINERRQNLVETLGSVGLEIEKLRVRMETQAGIYAETLRYGDGFVELTRPGRALYEITRIDGETTEIVEASESTRLQPGDVLRVALPGPGIAAIPSGPLARPDAGLPSDISLVEAN